MSQRRILVTSALPYANGSIHIGHLLEYLQTDIWVRYLRLRGHDAHYFCADDTHGTPVMIRAMREKTDPEVLIHAMQQEHQKDFADFGIVFDNFHSTHSPENQRWSEFFYERLKQAGHLDRRQVEQNFCEHDGLFLPDRLVRGTCPRPDCQATDQYGDSCEQCGATYSPTELGDPRCSICHNPPIRKSSEHIFVKLSDFTDLLRTWTQEHLQEEIANYVGRWIEEGLRDWDISRDGPYFGFPIPGEENKYFYVWLDAPIGYIASTDHWCQQNDRNVDEFWRDANTEIHHIIGKDIVYFHTLFWPAMLHAAGLNLPTKVHVHGFLRVEGEKMSKSRGTFINARTYLDHLDYQYLRYYYAARLSDKSEDIDLVFEDFVNRVNADLVNKVANLYSRNLKFVQSRLDSTLGTISASGKELVDRACQSASAIEAAYERRDLAKAVQLVTQLAEEANLYIQNQQPWKVLTEDVAEARNICTAAANLGLILAIYLKPVLPEMVARIETMLNVPALTWEHLAMRLENTKIGPFERLVERLDRKPIDAMLEASREEFEKMEQQDPVEQQQPHEPLAPECTVDDFGKVDLRVAQIKEAQLVKGADKLLQLTLDLGPLGRRNVFAGIRESYPDPSVLLDRKVVCVANLKPRKMRFGLSQGMVCASSRPDDDDRCVRVLAADPDALPGDRVS